MNWLATFRDECFNSHPILYILLIVLLGVSVLRYVWKSEKELAEKHRLNHRRPFK
jgi:hypothetical protein